MNVLQDFLSQYANTILYAVLTGIAGYLGMFAKKLYMSFRDDKTKENVVRTCVKAVEQLYRDLHGEEKLTKALEGASEMLQEKGVAVSELELRFLIESALAEYNKAFERTGTESGETAS